MRVWNLFRKGTRNLNLAHILSSDELMRSSGLSAASVDSSVGSQSPRLSKAEAKLAKKMEKMEKKKMKKMKGIEVSI